MKKIVMIMTMIRMTMMMIDQDDNGGDGQVYAAMAESLGGAWKEIHQAKNFIVFADLERNYIIWELVSGGFEAETSA